MAAPSLRAEQPEDDRLPADLLASRDLPDFDALPFTPLYLTGAEFAAEIANKTVQPLFIAAAGALAALTGARTALLVLAVVLLTGIVFLVWARVSPQKPPEPHTGGDDRPMMHH